MFNGCSINVCDLRCQIFDILRSNYASLYTMDNNSEIEEQEELKFTVNTSFINEGCLYVTTSRDDFLILPNNKIEFR